MKIDLQYLGDVNGKTNAVLLPFSDWEKLLNKLKKYEQTLKIKSDLKEAYEQVIFLKENKKNKQTLSEFLNEL
jgi:PHD/YefM family antitoxin component YafN of YafNO toxin-antitoxin module